MTGQEKERIFPSEESAAEGWVGSYKNQRGRGPRKKPSLTPSDKTSAVLPQPMLEKWGLYPGGGGKTGG